MVAACTLAREILAAADLSPGEKVVGAALSLAGPLDGPDAVVLRDLATRCRLRESAVRRHLQRLVASGYVRKAA